ncbi:hypothetical protein T484DRAFT_1938748 [Baffinella frigidus]|nr:hypothetical protein T484DRAFT_1938748 [Cryptophyta sp. CCMP2293]
MRGRVMRGWGRVFIHRLLFHLICHLGLHPVHARGALHRRSSPVHRHIPALFSNNRPSRHRRKPPLLPMTARVPSSQLVFPWLSQTPSVQEDPAWRRLHHCTLPLCMRLRHLRVLPISALTPATSDSVERQRVVK